jgi:hypothetical protein
MAFIPERTPSEKEDPDMVRVLPPFKIHPPPRPIRTTAGR